MAKQKMNVKLLLKVSAHIFAEPRRYNQYSIICTDKATIRSINGSVPPCGTMACIGGWAYLLGTTERERKRNEQKKRNWRELDIAAKKLGLNAKQIPRLFSVPTGGGWPEQFKDAYLRARTPLERAKVAVNRIRHFIKTNGAE